MLGLSEGSLQVYYMERENIHGYSFLMSVLLSLRIKHEELDMYKDYSLKYL